MKPLLLNQRRTTPQKILMQCLVSSLTAHIAMLTYFYFHPMLLHSPLYSLFGITAAKPIEMEQEEAELLEKNRRLEEVFQEIVVLPPHFQKPYDLAELPKGLSLSPNQEIALHTLPEIVQDSPFPGQEVTFVAAPTKILDTLQKTPSLLLDEKESGKPLVAQLHIDGTLPLTEPPSPMLSGLNNELTKELLALTTDALKAGYETANSSRLPSYLTPIDPLCIKEEKTNFTHISTHFPKQGHSLEEVLETLTPSLPNIPFHVPQSMEISSTDSFSDSYDFPDFVTTVEYGDDFDVEIAFLPNPEGIGYIFSLSVQPKDHLDLPRLEQNLYFIIDRSSSVQKHRFGVFKRAVVKALSCMQKTDKFNIFLVDKKVTSFTSQGQIANTKTIQSAEKFLEKQESGGLFGSGDVYTTLEKILPFISENEEAHTIILLTDGKTTLKNEHKQKTLKTWVEKNKGKVAVYACAVGRDNDLLTLDMLSTMSGGKLLYSDTHASLPRKVAKLVLDLKDPIAKEIIVSASLKETDNHIQLYSVTPNSLYSHQPYVIVGQIDTLADFDLVIQGRQRDQWIELKKTISFNQGHKGTASLEKLWKSHHAQTHYGRFLEQGKAASLKVAKEILKKARTEVAFE